jgi:alpha-1,6-mannosyltransferase
MPMRGYGMGSWQRLGLTGSVMIAAGGVLAGVAPARDPLLLLPGIDELREATVFATAVVYVGLTLLLVAWWNLGALVRRPDGPSTRELLSTGVWWAMPFALTAPIFSRDMYSYLAQGAMTMAGMDTYKVGPAALGGQLAANVPAIWQNTPTPYGPVFLDLAGAVARLTGQNTWPGIIGMRILALVGIGLIAWSVPHLARMSGVDPAAAVWLGVLNPLVLLHLVADAHNDALMLGLMAAGLVLTLRGHPWLGVATITLAGLVKAPAAVAIAFVVPIWAGQLAGRARWVRATSAAALTAAGTAIVVTALAGTGYGWVGALKTPTLARTWMSVTTDLGYVYGQALRWLRVATLDQTRDAFWLAGLVVAAALFVLLLRHSTRVGTVAALGLCLAALVLLAPVVHPWYLLWGIVPLATAGSDMVRRAVAVLSAALVLFVLPGGVPPGLPVLLGASIGVAIALLALGAFNHPRRRQPWTGYASGSFLGRKPGRAGSVTSRFEKRDFTDQQQRRGLGGRVHRIDGPGPAEANAVARVTARAPQPVRVCLKEPAVAWRTRRVGAMQPGQALHEDTFEDLRVSAAPRLLAGLSQDATGVDAVGNGGVGDLGRLREIVATAGDLGQFGEGGKDDPLVVGPRGTAVVDARGVEAVVHPMNGVDHSAGLEPGPRA